MDFFFFKRKENPNFKQVKKRGRQNYILTFINYERRARLTESSLCLLGTLSQKSLKLTLGSVAGPGIHGKKKVLSFFGSNQGFKDYL